MTLRCFQIYCRSALRPQNAIADLHVPPFSSLQFMIKEGMLADRDTREEMKTTKTPFVFSLSILFVSVSARLNLFYHESVPPTSTFCRSELQFTSIFE